MAFMPILFVDLEEAKSSTGLRMVLLTSARSLLALRDRVAPLFRFDAN
jgi:hypothetical protein